jgi:hypothetical protein
MDGEPLMDSEGFGEVKSALAAFPGLADVAGRVSTALGVRLSMADLFKASTVGDIDRRLDLMADARK